MPFQPLHDYMVVRPDRADKTPGGILIKPSILPFQWGTVVSVGPKQPDGDAKILPGARVYLASGEWVQEHDLDGEKVWLIRHDAILGVQT